MGRRRYSLRLRMVVGLLFVSVTPLAVSALLVEEVAEVAQNFASNRIEQLTPHLEASQRAYVELIRAKKQLFREITFRIAASRELAGASRPDFGAQGHHPLDRLLASSTELLSLEVVDATGQTIAVARREKPENGVGAFRPLQLEKPIPNSSLRVRAEFAADLDLVEEYEALATALRTDRAVDEMREELPSSYGAAFLTLLGGVVVLVTAIGIALAGRITTRVDELVSGTRRIAEGDLAARVDGRGRDELAELAHAFNRMAEELLRDRRKILYLQRIGAWQDVARRLAHEIKNPLTPIQLAVQQVTSSYKGEDERYRRQLHDAEEIVREEIDSLRRLVDAFRTLGQLPKVDAKPIALATVVADLENDPVFRDRLSHEESDDPVTVRGDRLLLRRLLANLAENGMQAGEEHGKTGRVEIRYRADRDSGMAVVTVDDEGPGVAADRVERVFEPYVTSKDTGTGLGLAIAKKIAIEHGGSLEIADDASPLGGARFVLTVPLGDES